MPDKLVKIDNHILRDIACSTRKVVEAPILDHNVGHQARLDEEYRQLQIPLKAVFRNNNVESYSLETELLARYYAHLFR